MRDSRNLALAGMAGGVLLILGNIVLLFDPAARGLASAGDSLTVAIVVAGALLVAAGLAGVHLAQRTTYGKLGLTGFVLALIAQLAAAAFFVTPTELPLLIGLLAGVAGYVVLTIAIVRAPVLPRWTGYIAFVGFVGLLVVSEADLGIAAAGVTWIAIGYAARSESERSVTPAPSPA